MLEVKDSSTFKLKSTAVVHNILGKTFFILDSDSGKQYDLTEMEYEIIDMISQGKTFIDIVKKIASKYEVIVSQIETDLREYCFSLYDVGLIMLNN